MLYQLKIGRILVPKIWRIVTSNDELAITLMVIKLEIIHEHRGFQTASFRKERFELSLDK